MHCTHRTHCDVVKYFFSSRAASKVKVADNNLNKSQRGIVHLVVTHRVVSWFASAVVDRKRERVSRKRGQRGQRGQREQTRAGVGLAGC